MADSIREQIIKAFVGKLADIRTANGFQTDVGQLVQRVAYYFQRGQLPAITVFPAPDVTERDAYDQENISMRLQITAVVLHEDMNPSEIAEKVLADIRECVEGVERELSFEDGAAEIVPGDVVVGSVSAAVAKVMAVTVTSGSWGAGTAEGVLRLRGQSGEFEEETLDIDGGESDAAAIGGDSRPYPAACAAVGDSYKRGLRYLGGGVEDYPEADDAETKISASYEITYRTTGGPYAEA